MFLFDVYRLDSKKLITAQNIDHCIPDGYDYSANKNSKWLTRLYLAATNRNISSRISIHNTLCVCQIFIKSPINKYIAPYQFRHQRIDSSRESNILILYRSLAIIRILKIRHRQHILSFSWATILVSSIIWFLFKVNYIFRIRQDF